MNLVTIKSFSDNYEANICKSQLDAAGIHCFIKNAGIIGANPLLSLATGNYELQVSEVDAERALRVLNN